MVDENEWDDEKPYLPAGTMQPGVDYIYCRECRKHVPCVRLESGVWEVQCPRCVGECGLCSCHSTGVCVGKGKVPVRTHMYVVDIQTKP